MKSAGKTWPWTVCPTASLQQQPLTPGLSFSSGADAIGGILSQSAGYLIWIYKNRSLVEPHQKDSWKSNRWYKTPPGALIFHILLSFIDVCDKYVEKAGGKKNVGKWISPNLHWSRDWSWIITQARSSGEDKLRFENTFCSYMFLRFERVFFGALKAVW